MNIPAPVRTAVLACVAALCAAAPARAQIWDAADDFSPTHNPNGAWSYGWSAPGYTVFNAFAAPAGPPDSFVDYGHTPGVFYNGTNTMRSYSYHYAPGQLGLHPGSGNERAIVRFTAPVTAIYSLAAAFVGLDNGVYYNPSAPASSNRTTVDAWVLLNGNALFSAYVDGYGAPSLRSYSNSALALQAGDRVDFAVGYGNNGYLFDSTGLEARFAVGDAGAVATPEPVTLVLLGSGLAGVVAARRRRRGAV